MKVFINPGHGQKSNGTYDPGAVNSRTGYQEATCVKAVGALLEAKLRSAGIQTYSYQDGDVNDVSRAANNWGADLFVSIHCNSFSDISAHGTETLYYPTSSKGKALAQSIQSQLITYLDRTDRGIKSRDNLGVLRDTVMPAALAELAFISNTEEEALLKSSSGQERAAEALAQGICRYAGVSYSGYTVQTGQPAEPAGNLGKGDTGDGVRWIQAQLNAYGYSLDVDGDFGPLTDAATRDFQGKNGLAVDGIVGPLTRAALLCPYSEPSANLQRGSTGDGVCWVQWYLSQKGYVLNIDGDFGPITQSSVIAFQKSRGLAQDGIVGPLTRNKLKNS